MIPSGRTFYKMSGSGNDFVMVDARRDPPGQLADPSTIARICARGTGVGADGIVFLERSTAAAVKLVYLNSDGSPADFCGNATLCTTRLISELGGVDAQGFTIETESGVVSARMVGQTPEIDLPAVAGVRTELEDTALEPGERRIGFALAGVPHLVIRLRRRVDSRPGGPWPAAQAAQGAACGRERQLRLQGCQRERVADAHV